MLLRIGIISGDEVMIYLPSASYHSPTEEHFITKQNLWAISLPTHLDEHKNQWKHRDLFTPHNLNMFSINAMNCCSGSVIYKVVRVMRMVISWHSMRRLRGHLLTGGSFLGAVLGSWVSVFVLTVCSLERLWCMAGRLASSSWIRKEDYCLIKTASCVL